MNESVLDETGRLYRAIREDKKVSFRFFHYDREKKKQYSKSGGRYIVSPYAILWNDGRSQKETEYLNNEKIGRASCRPHGSRKFSIFSPGKNVW